MYDGTLMHIHIRTNNMRSHLLRVHTQQFRSSPKQTPHHKRSKATLFLSNVVSDKEEPLPLTFVMWFVRRFQVRLCSLFYCMYSLRNVVHHISRDECIQARIRVMTAQYIHIASTHTHLLLNAHKLLLVNADEEEAGGVVWDEGPQATSNDLYVVLVKRHETI